MIFNVVDYDTTESKSEQGTLLRLYALFYTICKYDSYTEPQSTECRAQIDRDIDTHTFEFSIRLLLFIFFFFLFFVCVCFYFLSSFNLCLVFIRSAFGTLLSSTVSNTVYLHAHSKSIPFYCERFAQIAHDHLSMFELIGCKTHLKLCLSTEYGRYILYTQCLCVSLSLHAKR